MLGSTNIVAFVPIKDAQRSRPFYEGVLGLKFISDDQFALVMEANGIMVRLAKVGKVVPASFTVLGWEVSGIEKVVEGLKAKSVQFEKFPGLPQDDLGIWTTPNGDKVAWFKDPDGNVLSVSEHI